MAFLVVPPFAYVPDYDPVVKAEIAEALGLLEDTPRLIFTMVTIPPGQPEEMTINLAGPLVINADTRMAKQVVIEHEAYTIRHRVFVKADRISESAVA